MSLKINFEAREDLRHDLKPVGVLEHELVQKMAACLWKDRRAARCESGLIEREFFEYRVKISGREERLYRTRRAPNEVQMVKHLWLPAGDDLDRILRYEAANNRQLIRP